MRHDEDVHHRAAIPGTDRERPVDVDDAALSLVRFANGAIGSLEGTRFATGRKNYNRFEINGSKGSIVFDLERLNELERLPRGGPGQRLHAP